MEEQQREIRGADRQLIATMLAEGGKVEEERRAAKEQYDASVKYMEESNFPSLVEELKNKIPKEQFPFAGSRET